MEPALTALGDEKTVLLTTFRKSGEPVGTPIWIARDGDLLVVTTTADSGKVKRLRHTSRVQLQACSTRGKVRDGAPVVSASAEVVPVGPDTATHEAVLKKKYGVPYRLIMLGEKIARRGRAERVIVRVTAAS